MKKLLQNGILLLGVVLLTTTATFSQGTTTPPATPTPPATTPPATTTAPAPAPDQPIKGPFATDTTPTTVAPTGPVNPDTLQVSIAFVKADLPSVLGFLSMASGIPIVIDGDLNGTVTIQSVKSVTLTEAYDVINSALRVRGYTMLGSLKDKIIRVVPLKKAAGEPIPLRTDPTKVGDSDSIITEVIPLQFISALKLKDELKPLVPDDQANMLAVSSTNTLVLTDSEANIKRLLQIISLLDVDTSDVINLEVYQCKYASASILIASLSQALGLTNGQSTPPTSSTATTPVNPFMRGGPGGGGGRFGPNQPTTPTTTPDSDAGGLISMQGQLNIASDDRTNSLIIAGSKAKIALVLKLVTKLDIDTTPEVTERTFQLKFADATMVASQLTSLFQQSASSSASGGGGNPFQRMMAAAATSATPSYISLKENTIVADVRTNSVLVTASKQNMEEFQDVIATLDIPNPIDNVVHTYQLKFLQATTVATELQNLFSGNAQTGSTNASRTVAVGNATMTTNTGDPLSQLKNITVVADPKSNSLLITGPPQAFASIEALIKRIDVRISEVYIEVKVIDVNLTNQDQFGIEWNLLSGSLTNSIASATGTTSYNGNGTTGSQNFGMANTLAGGGFSYGLISGNLQAFLYGIGANGNAKVISSPNITAEDNTPSSVTIGETVPYESGSSVTNGVTTYSTANEPVNISLSVTPHVNESTDVVGLDVDQIVNEILIPAAPPLNAPTLANREAKTSVMVKDGQTIVIGGMFTDEVTRNENNVPFLSKIPLLGELFKSHNNVKNRTELMVFLTPHILTDDTVIQTITNKVKIESDSFTSPLSDEKKKR